MVRRIPRGKVATYGQIAALIGQPRAARAVGHALRLLPSALQRVVPWQRVINVAGRISHRGEWQRPQLQRELLESEGVPFDRSGKIDLTKVRWRGTVREDPVTLSRELPLNSARPCHPASRRRSTGGG